MTATETLRVKTLRFLESLKDGITIQRENFEIAYVLDPSADYDLFVRRINNNVIIMVYSKYVRCTIRVYVDKNDEWHLRSVSCRR
jgi:hypothetical protein